MKSIRKLTILCLAFGLAAMLAGAYAEPLRYFGQTPNSYQSQMPYGNNAQTGRYALSEGTRIYYEVYGQGVPIVVLHGGLAGSIAEMGQFIDNLTKTRQVIAINTRGHGKSEVGNAVPSYEQKARDLRAVLKQENIVRADFLGFSDGAYTALMFARQYPQITQKVIAIGAGEWKKGFRDLGKGDFAEFAKLDSVYWEQQAEIRPEPKRTAEWFAQSVRYYNTLEFGGNVLSQVNAPVLLVVGEDDANAPLDTVLNAYRMLPNADLAVIADSPHQAFDKNFPAVWSAVEPFLTNP